MVFFFSLDDSSSKTNYKIKQIKVKGKLKMFKGMDKELG